MLYELDLNVTSQVIQQRAITDIKMASDTVNEVWLNFTFDDKWKQFDVVHAVIRNCGSKREIPPQVIENNRLLVPWEAFTSVGKVKIYLYANIVDEKGIVIDRVTTYEETIINVLEKVNACGGLEPTGGEFEFLIRKIYELQMPVRIKEWLYDARYRSVMLDYEYAYQFMKDKYMYKPKTPYSLFSTSRIANMVKGVDNIKSGKCSAIYKRGWLLKNLDWYYNWCMNFVVRTDGTGQLNRTMGVAGGISSLTKQVVEDGGWTSAYRILPFIINEGINDYGLSVSTNVVPNFETKNGKQFTTPTTGTNPSLDVEPTCTLMLVRYLLDHCKTADECVYKMQNEMNIYAPLTEALVEEMHLLITDEGDDKTGRAGKQYIVEFIDNKVIAIDVTNNYPWMTNYYRKGARFEEDGTLIWQSLTDHPQGVHRNNLIARDYSGITSIRDAMVFMQTTLKYTNAYIDDYWMDEFTANYGEPYGDLTIRDVYEHPEKFQPILDIVHDRYQHRSRDKGDQTWQTVHSAVYDIKKGELWVVVEEEGVTNSVYFNIDPNKDKVDTFQGFDNFGKILSIDENGKVFAKSIGELGGDKFYNFVQAEPSDVWEIEHNMDKYPSVEILDSTGREVFGGMEYISSNKLMLYFSKPISGTAKLN